MIGCPTLYKTCCVVVVTTSSFSVVVVRVDKGTTYLIKTAEAVFANQTWTLDIMAKIREDESRRLIINSHGLIM